MANNLALPGGYNNATNGQGPGQGQISGSPQRFSSPMQPPLGLLQQAGANPNQILGFNGMGNFGMANMNAGQQQQQVFAQQNQAQAQAYQQAYLAQLQQSGMLQGRQTSSSPFNNNNNNTAINAGASAANGQFMNIHRSPVYGNTALPGQQVQQGYNPYQPSPSPMSQNAQLPPGGNGSSGVNAAGFTPQQAFQLQQLHQQQAQLHQHQQALQAFTAGMGQQANGGMPSAAGVNGAGGGVGVGGVNAQNTAQLQALFQQLQQQNNQHQQGPNGQPQIQIPPQQQQQQQQGGQAQGQQMQFNPAMLNQLRQQQLSAGGQGQAQQVGNGIPWNMGAQR
jgi:hypothetical protein